MSWDNFHMSTPTTLITNALEDPNGLMQGFDWESTATYSATYQAHQPTVQQNPEPSRFGQPLEGQKTLQQMMKDTPIQCYLHNCGGRTFSCLSNYRRHCKEKDGVQEKVACPRCGQTFSRKAARKLHLDKDRCKVMSFDANGVPYRQPWWMANLEAQNLLDLECQDYQLMGVPGEGSDISQRRKSFSLTSGRDESSETSEEYSI
ncbi:hypothetical protein F5Y19DRAFT_490358 [Xylariaceae sp. FL1651]|nr:hypothetical protein F5Y19DRAFT_490358 [Xylariaceae sp. FL1651]